MALFGLSLLPPICAALHPGALFVIPVMLLLLLSQLAFPGGRLEVWSGG